MEKRHYKLTGLEVRAKSDEAEGRAKGYAAVFNSDSHDLGGFVERIDPKAFNRTLKEGHSIYLLWAHRDDKPLASTGGGKLELFVDKHGLGFEADTSRMSAAELDALKDGDLRMSFGFSVREQEWIEDEAGNVERTLKDVDLYEVSFVISPAYPETEASLRSHEEARQSFEAWKAEKSEEPTSEPQVDEARRIDLIARALRKRV